MPFWWDKKISSLASTIYNSRPDLFETQPQGQPIPLTKEEKTKLLQSSIKFPL